MPGTQNLYCSISVAGCDQLFAAVIDRCVAGLICIEDYFSSNRTLNDDFLPAFSNALASQRMIFCSCRRLRLLFQLVDITPTSGWMQFLTDLKTVVPLQISLSLWVYLLFLVYGWCSVLCASKRFLRIMSLNQDTWNFTKLKILAPCPDVTDFICTIFNFPATKKRLQILADQYDITLRTVWNASYHYDITGWATGKFQSVSGEVSPQSWTRIWW